MSMVYPPIGTLEKGIATGFPVMVPTVAPNAALTETSDAAGDTSTTYGMSVGDTFTGSFSATGDTDWVRVTLTAGESYDFGLTDTGSASLGSPSVTLYDAAGNVVTTDDDGGPSRASLLSHTATSSGTFYIGVHDASGAATGGYDLSMTTTTLPATDVVYTNDQIADYLLRGFWEESSGITNTPMAFNIGPGSTLTFNITALTAEGQQLARWAMESWGQALGITFSESTSTNASIMFDDSDPGVSAYAGPSSLIGTQILQSNVMITTGWLTQFGTSIDSYGFQTYLHEVGHALGLGHAGNYDGTATYGTSNHYANDSWQATVMSYFSQTDNTFINADYAYIVTPMVADLVAVGISYGGTTTQVQAYDGNTRWGANSNMTGYLGDLFGQIFNEDAANSAIYAGGPVALTIQDTGGIDTLDLSPVTANQRIDMNSEAISDIMGLTGNMVIARDTVIENLISGSGNDVITGNDLASGNTIFAGQGNDVVNSGGGTDRVFGGQGNDLIRGGDGNDTLHGEAGADRMFGEAGDDHMRGGWMGDWMYGGADNDLIQGEEGNDHLFGGRGNDQMFGGIGNDTLFGADDNDFLSGGVGNDRLFGENGNDFLSGDAGNDTMTGGANSDRFIFRDGFGLDVITDFEVNNALERIDLRNVAAITDQADLFANHMFQVGSDVEIRDLLGNVITVQNVTLADLQNGDDFLL